MRILTISILLFFFSNALAQTQPTSCVDSSKIEDKLFNCGHPPGGYSFDPVCGCDGNTYKNACAAINWGRLTQWTSNTVCGNFYIDFYPTAVTQFSGTFSIYLKTISPVTLYIYDAFGKLKYSDYYTNIYCSKSGGNQNLFCAEIPVQNLDLGVYILIAVVNGEHQSIRFAKISKFE